MNLNDLAKKLAVAGLTTLGSAVAEPAGAITAGLVAKRIGAAEADPAVLAQALDADPEAIIRLRELDAEMRREEQAHIERVLAAEAAERERLDAEMQAGVAAARAATSGHWLTPILTLILVAMVIAAATALFLIEPPQANRDLLNFVLGNVMGWAGAGIVYWLGSSRGSADRAATLDRLVTRK